MILHLIETAGPGGAEQMLLRLADEYSRRGIEQTVCLRKDGWLAEEVRHRNLQLIIFPLGYLPDLPWLRQLGRFSRAKGVKAVHAHEFAMNVRGTLLGKWLHMPVVATVHGKSYYTDKWSRRQAYRFASNYSNLIAVSEDIRHNLISVCGLQPHRVVVIPNGIDPERYRFDEMQRRDYRQRFDVHEDQLLLGTVGSYYPVKGHRFLIEAMQRLLTLTPNLKLVMAGQGPLESELQTQIRESGLEHRTKIVGYIKDIPGFLSALDIFVMPSLSEGLPLALLEAAANRRCIVATRVGGIPEIIVHEESGILVPPGNVEALANGLAELLDPMKRSRLASNAAATVNTKWSIQSTAERYLELLLPGESF